MKIFKVIYFIVGLLTGIVCVMLLLAQYNIVENAYSSANKDSGAKALAWILLSISVFFVTIPFNKWFKTK